MRVDQMESRHGWSYSLFAGVVALPIAVWFARAHDTAKWVLLAATMTLAAMVAARVGGWLAILSGGRDYGWRAASYTGILYLLFCGCLGVVLLHLRADPGYDSWVVARQEGVLFFAWWFLKQVLGSFSGFC